MARGIFEEVRHWIPEPVSNIAVISRTEPSPQALRLAEEFRVDLLRDGTADAAIDSGYDLLIVADDVGALPALTLIAVFANVNAAAVMSTSEDDDAWMQLTASIRDGMRSVRPHLGEVQSALDVVAEANISAMHLDLLAAARREVPVLINGVGALAAAVTADRVSHAARRWWMVADRTSAPAIDVAMQRTDLPALTSSDIGDALVGALLVVPAIRAAFDA